MKPSFNTQPKGVKFILQNFFTLVSKLTIKTLKGTNRERENIIFGRQILAKILKCFRTYRNQSQTHIHSYEKFGIVY